MLDSSPVVSRSSTVSRARLTALILHRDTTWSRSQTIAVDPGQRLLHEEPWAGSSVGLERFPEVDATPPAKEELPKLGVQLFGLVAFAARLTKRDGVVRTHLEEQRP
jgi:hypothetical protein